MAPARKLAWSPDGRRLAFEVIEDRRYNIYLATLDDWKPERRAVHFARPAWSPEGKTLAASTGHCIYTCETLTLNTDQPYTDPEHLVWDGWSPAYSPDGSRIAYVRMSGDDGYHSLHVMNADGSDDRYVTGGEGPAFDYPSWAPDGTRIAFASCTADGCRLMVVGSNGSGLREVLPGASILSPTWSPDGRWIAFSWIRDQHDWEVEGIATIAYVSPNGGTPAVVGYGRNPAWRVR
jgi:Tol biopolymer transport system component